MFIGVFHFCAVLLTRCEKTINMGVWCVLAPIKGLWCWPVVMTTAPFTVQNTPRFINSSFFHVPKNKMLPFHISDTIPEDLENLIIQYAYPVTCIMQLNMCAHSAFQNASNLNVPSTWKRLLKNSQPQFAWKNFLLSNLNPYSPVTQISLGAVRDTVRRLCWGYLKYQPCLACNLARDLTKSEVLKILHFWTPCSCEIMYKIQRILCSVDINRAIINHGCLCHIYLSNETPLALQLNAIR